MKTVDLSKLRDESSERPENYKREVGGDGAGDQAVTLGNHDPMETGKSPEGLVEDLETAEMQME